MKKKLTNEEKRKKVRDEFYLLCNEHKPITEFTYHSLKKRFEFNDFKKILLDLINQKIIKKKFAGFFFYIPNDIEGKKALKRFEYNLGKKHWIDQFVIFLGAILITAMLFSVLLTTYPDFLIDIVGQETKPSEYFLLGVMLSSLLIMVVYMFLFIILDFIGSLELKKSISIGVKVVLIFIIVIISFYGNSTRVNTFVGLLGTLLSLYLLFNDKIDKFIEKKFN